MQMRTGCCDGSYSGAGWLSPSLLEAYSTLL